MKKIALFIMCLLICLTCLTGCGKTYQEATNTNETHIGKGYFTTIKHWGGGGEATYEIIYANDTKVMYFAMISNYAYEITPLYNSDGTLQIYSEE